MKKYKELITYLVFGVLTTAVNYVVYYLASRLIEGAFRTAAATAIAWVISVLFAYWTNRTWVFGHRASGLGGIMREMGLFFGARVFSGLLDLGIMVAAVDYLRLPDMPIKIISNILVIIINYVLSKFLIFRKQS